MRYEIRVGDQHARRVGVGAEDADRLARLHEQRLIRLETAERRNDPVESLPVARGAPDAAIDDELAGPFGDIRVEVVHQHPQGRLGEPAFRAPLGAAWGAYDAHVVEAGRDGHGEGLSIVRAGAVIAPA